MEDQVLSIDLVDLHATIRDQIAQRFTHFQTIEFYRDDESEHLPTPACLLQLDEFEANDTDPGTGQIEVTLRFTARLIFSREGNSRAPLETRLAAAALSAFISNRRFVKHLSPARIMKAYEDGFTPDDKGRYAVYALEWMHEEALFGENVWLSGDSSPYGVFVEQRDGFLDGSFVEVDTNASR